MVMWKMVMEKQEMRYGEVGTQSSGGSASAKLSGKSCYGFGGRFTGVFASLRSELQVEATRLASPDDTSVEEREILEPRTKTRYLMPSDMVWICSAVMMIWFLSRRWGMQPHYIEKGDGDISAQLEGLSLDNFFTAAEKEAMRNLPRRRYEMTSAAAESEAMRGLADILFGYAYDHRFTYGEPTVESDWTIWSLSYAVVVTASSVKRSIARHAALTYPYLRWDFVKLIFADVASTFAEVNAWFFGACLL